MHGKFFWSNQKLTPTKFKFVNLQASRDQLVSMITSRPTSSSLPRSNQNILSILYDKTRLKPDMVEREIIGHDRCLIARDLSKIKKIVESTRLFFVGDRRQADFMLATSSMFAHLIPKLWISPKAIYEHPKVIYYQNANTPTIGNV